MQKAMNGKESGDPMPRISTRLLFYTLEYVLLFQERVAAGNRDTNAAIAGKEAAAE